MMQASKELWFIGTSFRRSKFMPIWGGYSHTLPIRVCAAQRGCDFEAPDLEPSIHFKGVF